MQPVYYYLLPEYYEKNTYPISQYAYRSSCYSSTEDIYAEEYKGLYPILYAYASDKKGREVFEATRDMRKFLTSKKLLYPMYREDSTPTDMSRYLITELPDMMVWNEYNEDWSTLRMRLPYYEYEHIIASYQDIVADRYYDLVMEYMDNNNDIIPRIYSTYTKMSKNRIFYQLFKKKPRQALAKIGVSDILFTEEYIEQVDYTCVDYFFNFIHAYADVYGNTYKKGGVEQLCRYTNITS